MERLVPRRDASNCPNRCNLEKLQEALWNLKWAGYFEQGEKGKNEDEWVLDGNGGTEEGYVIELLVAPEWSKAITSTSEQRTRTF